MFEFRLQLAVALHLRRVGKIALELLHFGFHLRKTRYAAQRIFEQSLFRRIGFRVLAGETDARRAFDYQLAGIGRHLAEDDLEKSRLARPVRPDNAYAVALVDAERYAGKNVLVPVMDGYVPEIKHRAPLARELL